MTARKLQYKAIKDSAATHIGSPGDIFYDPDVAEFRMYDGTPGGMPVGVTSNDIVVNTTLNSSSDWLSPSSQCFAVDTGVTMQEIQDSIAAEGKWACFSGFEIIATVRSDVSVDPAYQYYNQSRYGTAQLINCILLVESCGACYYGAVYWNSTCNTVTHYPMSYCGSPSYICFGNYCGAPGTPNAICCGTMYTAISGTSGASLACTAKIFFEMSNVGVCGAAYPQVKVTTFLKFENFSGR
jgi:hypothetical protein